VKKGQDNGVFSNEQTSRALARFLFNTLTGIRVSAKTGGDKKMYDDIVKVTMAALK
jgi:TetR/AcrR family transcriptional repressor of nem operon